MRFLNLAYGIKFKELNSSSFAGECCNESRRALWLSHAHTSKQTIPFNRHTLYVRAKEPLRMLGQIVHCATVVLRIGHRTSPSLSRYGSSIVCLIIRPFVAYRLVAELERRDSVSPALGEILGIERYRSSWRLVARAWLKRYKRVVKAFPKNSSGTCQLLPFFLPLLEDLGLSVVRWTLEAYKMCDCSSDWLNYIFVSISSFIVV